MTNKLALVVAVVLGVLSILGIRFYVEKIKSQYDRAVDPIAVPVAARDLRFGEVVTRADIVTKEFPRAALEGVARTIYDDPTKLEGLKVIVPEIKANQIYQQYHFRQSTQVKRLKVPSGFRAMTIPASQLNSLSGMLRPDDVIDVISTIQFQEIAGAQKSLPTAGEKIKLTATILKKVRILACDSVTDPETSYADYSTITLQLSPADVNKLLYIMDGGGSLHVVKLDETATPAPTTDAMFAEKLFQDVKPELERFIQELGRPR